MQESIDNFFLTIPEPQQSTLLFIRQFLISKMQLTEHRKFNTPFYYHQGKWFCYISYNKKKNHEIYLGFVKGYKVNHIKLLAEGRKQIKIFRINPDKDINVIELGQIVKLCKDVY